MAALRVKWESADSISKTAQVVTGEDAEEAEEGSGEPQLRWDDKPLLIYVCDEVACEDAEKFETIVLADEKVSLGVRAFRCLKMTPAQVEADPILEGEGRTTPRVMIVYLYKGKKLKMKVLEERDLKASKLFRAMERASDKFWEEDLDDVVKEHLDILTEQDQLANADQTLANKEDRVADDERELEEVKEERAEIAKQLQKLAEKQTKIWKLSRRT